MTKPHDQYAATPMHPIDNLYLACLAYAQRSSNDELTGYKKLMDYYRAQLKNGVDLSPATLRHIDRQAEGLWQVLRQGRPELEVKE